MSSSAPKLQPAPAGEPLPFCYAEARAGDESSAAKTEQAEEQMRRRESEAFERGRQAAEQQLRASFETAAVRSREQILGAVTEFARERTAYYRRIEGEVVELALAIARKILHREVQLDPHTLAGIVRVTLEKLDAGTTVNLRVHPREAADWRHYFASQAEGAAVAEVHEDPALAAGECRIETSLGTTDIGIESQLKEIETGLLDLLAERPDSGVGAPARATSGNAPAVAGGTRR